MRTLATSIVLSSSIHAVLSIPHSRPQPPHRIAQDAEVQLLPDAPPRLPRQLNPFSSLFIPNCALPCYVNALPTDGCAAEIDFRCHCTTGNLLGRAEACIQRACSNADQRVARERVRLGCQAAGANLIMVTSSTSSPPATTTSPATSAPSSTLISMVGPPAPSSRQPSIEPTTQSADQTAASSPIATNSSAPGQPTNSTTPTTTDTLPIIPQSNPSLSSGAKAGITVSVVFVVSAIFIGLFVYISRLKRQLALAKAAADMPDSAFRSTFRGDTIPDMPFRSSRRISWSDISRNRRSSRRSSRADTTHVNENPISPLSPVFFREGRRSSTMGFPINKRGTVLSMVIEREDEDVNSLMGRGRHVWEPVPGQSEGLADPLEMDGQFAAVYEAPTSITPRAVSRDGDREGREEWKEYDFGRPSRWEQT